MLLVNQRIKKDNTTDYKEIPDTRRVGGVDHIHSCRLVILVK